MKATRRFSSAARLACGLLLAAGMVGCGSEDPGARAAARRQGPPPTNVVLGSVIEREIRPDIRGIGTVEPNRQTTVGAEVSGIVERIDIREGDRVVRDKTVLVELRRTDREIALREAAAARARARAEWEKLQRGFRPEEVNQRRAEVRERRALMEQARRDWDRAKDLHADGAISIQQLQREEANYLAVRSQHEQAVEVLREAEAGYRKEDVAKAESEFRQAQAAYDRLRDELAKTVIRAPISGFVTKKHVEVGQWVDKGGQVVDLADLDRVRIVTLIAERDIGQIRVGTAASIAVDTYPGRTFTGTVTHIVPQADLQSRAFPVKIEVVNPPGTPLKGGMLARVTVPVGAPRRTILVPKDAVVRRGDREVVFAVNDRKAVRRELATGRAVDGYLEVVDGDLRSGEAIVVTGNEALRDGAPVVVTPAAPSGMPGTPGGATGQQS